MLRGGLLLFVGARLALVVSAALAMGMPRLGDDAYTYLWKGELFARGYSSQTPAQQDVLALRALDDAPDAALDWQRSRITMRASGAVAPVGDAIYAATRLLPLDAKWKFALVEAGIALVLAVALARFLSTFFGPTAAGLGLVLLAFTVFPNQGLSYFIPSTLTLALGLLAWAEIARPAPRWWLAAMLCVAMPFVHPIGQLYLALILAWPIAVWMGRAGALPSHALAKLGLIAVVPLALALVLPRVVPMLAPPPSGNLGGFALGHVVEQVPALGRYLIAVLAASPLLLLVPATAVAVTRAAWLEPRIVALIGLVLCALGASLLHQLPGYPAELASRILVVLVIVGAGVAGKAATLLWQDRRAGAIAVGVLFGAWIAVGGWFWLARHALEMQRPQIIHDTALRSRLAELPDEVAIVYFEADIGLFASLLQGADRHPAVVLPMLKGSPALTAGLTRHPLQLGLVPVSPGLNVLERKVWTVTAHRFGFPGHAVRSLRLAVPAAVEGQALWLHLGGRVDGQSVAQRLSYDGGRAEVGTLRLAPRDDGWMEIVRLEAGLRQVELTLPDADLWVTGIALDAPEPRNFWPWASGLELEFAYRGPVRPKRRSMHFAIEALLAEYRAADFAALVDLEHPVVSDDTGLVFLRLRAAPEVAAPLRRSE
jgi:hypothetical protein